MDADIVRFLLCLLEEGEEPVTQQEVLELQAHAAVEAYLVPGSTVYRFLANAFSEGKSQVEPATQQEVLTSSACCGRMYTW